MRRNIFYYPEQEMPANSCLFALGCKCNIYFTAQLVKTIYGNNPVVIANGLLLIQCSCPWCCPRLPMSLSLNYNLIANKIPCIKQRLRKVDGPLICCKPFSLSLQPHWALNDSLEVRMLGFMIRTSNPVSRLATQLLVKAVLLPQYRQVE